MKDGSLGSYQRFQWEEVRHAHVKNQNYGHAPSQHVFGVDIHVPGDLMSEPHVVPGTAGLSDQAIARAQAIRSARQAGITFQVSSCAGDNKS